MGDVEEAREAERQRLQLMYGDIDISSAESECFFSTVRFSCCLV